MMYVNTDISHDFWPIQLCVYYMILLFVNTNIQLPDFSYFSLIHSFDVFYVFIRNIFIPLTASSKFSRTQKNVLLFCHVAITIKWWDIIFYRRVNDVWYLAIIICFIINCVSEPFPCLLLYFFFHRMLIMFFVCSFCAVAGKYDTDFIFSDDKCDLMWWKCLNINESIEIIKERIVRLN